MSVRSDETYIADILDSLNRITDYIDGMTYDAFMTDSKTQDAVIRQLEIVGEASARVSDSLRTNYPSIPWSEIIGMRNKLIHGYFGVDLDIVWNTVTEDMLVLGEAFLRLKNEETTK